MEHVTVTVTVTHVTALFLLSLSLSLFTLDSPLKGGLESAREWSSIGAIGCLGPQSFDTVNRLWLLANHTPD